MRFINLLFIPILPNVQIHLVNPITYIYYFKEWGYPDIGVVICDCPSAGHDVVMLDYRACGKYGEPEVVHVDHEDDYEITFLADNFEEFVRGLVSEEKYDTSEEDKEEDKEEDLDKVAHGKFSPLLRALLPSN